VEAGVREVPVVVVGLIEEVEAVESLHPPDLDVYIQVFGIWLRMLVLIVMHLLEADGVALRDHCPIGRIAVDAGESCPPGTERP
jgi:hypothetical protein